MPKFNNDNYDSGSGSSVGKIVSWSVTGVVGLVLLTIVLGSWYTVGQSEVGVLTRNGAFVQVVQPGLSFKMPWIDSVARIDMQTHTYSYNKINSYSADQQPADMNISATIRLNPDKIREFYQQFGGDLKAATQRLISPILNKEAKNVFGSYTAVRSISNRVSLNNDIVDAFRKSMEHDPIFIVESLQLENIEFSPQYITSVEARMKAEVQVQEEKQKLERAKIEAEITKTKAEGIANGVREAAKAESDAIKLRGNAEAEAITARARALGDNPNLIGLVQAEKWDGKLPTSMPPNGTVPFLNLGTAH